LAALWQATPVRRKALSDQRVTGGVDASPKTTRDSGAERFLFRTDPRLDQRGGQGGGGLPDQLAADFAATFPEIDPDGGSERQLDEGSVIYSLVI